MDRGKKARLKAGLRNSPSLLVAALSYILSSSTRCVLLLYKLIAYRYSKVDGRTQIGVQIENVRIRWAYFTACQMCYGPTDYTSSSFSNRKWWFIAPVRVPSGLPARL